jgi:hypothetical protein
MAPFKGYRESWQAPPGSGPADLDVDNRCLIGASRAARW